MEMSASSWIPRSTRNRWAWGFAWASLLVMLVWNFLPYYEYDYNASQWSRRGLVMMDFWPSMLGDVPRLVRRSMDFEEIAVMIITLAMVFMALIQFVIAPLWWLFAASRLLRFIPASMCALGLCCLAYFLVGRILHIQESFSFKLFVMSLITLNFLLSLLALLLYHPEPIPEPES